ncbi:hypothetical protein E4U30_007522 [Claviceps sp. LM220 group G6]|nr:hypothetical protein E4U30_007522 [Claviceps sp. LM220 group G6]
MKKRWRILRDGPEQGFTMHQQSLFVYALAAVHNFCLQHGQTLEQDEDMLQGEDGGEDGDGDGYGDGNGGGGVEETGVEGGVMPEDAGMVRFRDRLAKNTWEEFINEKRGNGSRSWSINHTKLYGIQP